MDANKRRIGLIAQLILMVLFRPFRIIGCQFLNYEAVIVPVQPAGMVLPIYFEHFADYFL